MPTTLTRGRAALILLAGTAALRRLLRRHRLPIPGPRYLIVNADDFGLSPGVTDGIIRAWREGIVTSTSAMVTAPGATQRIAGAHTRHPDLPIGLHLTITAGRPILPPERVPSLVDAGGRFYPVEGLLARLPRVSLSELRAELAAQASALLAVGVQFDHIDYHEGALIIFPPFYRLALELAREYGVPVRQPVPEAVYGAIRSSRRRGAAAVIRRMIRFAVRHPVGALRLLPLISRRSLRARLELLAALHISSPNWFVDGASAAPAAADLVALLRRLPPGLTEIAVHPGRMDQQLRALGGRLVAAREAELEALLDPRVADAIRAAGIRLVDYSFLQPPEA